MSARRAEGRGEDFFMFLADAKTLRTPPRGVKRFNFIFPKTRTILDEEFGIAASPAGSLLGEPYLPLEVRAEIRVEFVAEYFFRKHQVR